MYSKIKEKEQKEIDLKTKSINPQSWWLDLLYKIVVDSLKAFKYWILKGYEMIFIVTIVIVRIGNKWRIFITAFF